MSTHLYFEKVKVMESKVYEGKIAETKINGKTFLTLDMPRKPEQAKMSFTLDSIFRGFLNKMMKITIEEIRE